MWTEARVREFWEHNESSFVADTTASEIVRLSRKYIKGRTLDVGAGSGALIDRIPQSVGIDLVSRHSMVIEGSVSEMPFEDGIFDTVMMTDVIEHLPDSVLCDGMKEILRVMKPKGKLIIVAPYREDFHESFVYCPTCGGSFHRWGHLRVINEDWMMMCLNTYGFNVVEMRLLPLGLMAEHRIIRHFWPWFVRFGIIKVNSLFVVAEKL